MERRIHLHLSLAYEPRALRPWLAAALVLLTASELASENLTLTTYYPAPSGVYTNMITTGNTYLARDGGRVGVGTPSPAVKFQVNGGSSRFAGDQTGYVDIYNTGGANEGGTINLRSNGGGNQYIENYSGDLRFINSNWTAENMRISNAGNLTVRGNGSFGGNASVTGNATVTGTLQVGSYAGIGTAPNVAYRLDLNAGEIRTGGIKGAGCYYRSFTNTGATYCFDTTNEKAISVEYSATGSCAGTLFTIWGSNISIGGTPVNSLNVPTCGRMLCCRIRP